MIGRCFCGLLTELFDSVAELDRSASPAQSIEFSGALVATISRRGRSSSKDISGVD
jgi:hypothetical protein